ncbi:MAG: YHYH protein [Flavobacteriales bacterium]|nr:YHYH protein [Flavobacteriales bacterium]
MIRCLFAGILLNSVGCNKDEDEDDTTCTSDQALDASRGSSLETLSFTPIYSEVVNGSKREITTNSIPAHKAGLFGSASGSLNPNAIQEVTETYNITTYPTATGSFTALLSTASLGGSQYSFGILFSGIEVDPIAAEPFPHAILALNVNWEWNLEALNVNIGLDCNNAHVQPTGKYHYHGSPELYISALNISTTEMTLIGYAADGFPIYYKYAYSSASDITSAVEEMFPSYELKSGDRPGDGESAPCDAYNGVYSNDYQYVSGLGDLDEANGRTGVTPEFPAGTYYYVITDDFPSIPRYFKETPSNDFTIN